MLGEVTSGVIAGGQSPFGEARLAREIATTQQQQARSKDERQLADVAGDGQDDEAEAPEIWHAYECKSLDFGRPHPGSIVEASALASVRLPSHSYPLKDSLRQQIYDGSLSSMVLFLSGVTFLYELTAFPAIGGSYVRLRATLKNAP